MKTLTFDELNNLVTILKTRLFGQIVNEKIVTDVFLTPNDWETAKIVYDFRKSYRKYPFNPNNNFSVIVIFSDNEMKDIKELNSKDLLNDFQEEISWLFQMQ